ncbi:GAS2-like protein 2A [Anguilla anguilla]|uniref:GAS2-like protein 2A n=1 Tax=Anguilla anguilla TaxID=7936 RepID=UPI0015AC3ADE|nr:GAS2-like protein 2A [Anguilla anguilla]
MSGIEQATNCSIKPFKSSEEYLYAMKEDLAEWLKDLYDVDIAVNNFLQVLETGAVLCHHANNVTRVAADFLRMYGQQALKMKMPTSEVTFVASAQPSTFLARDNISNFINWCRKQMDIKDVLMFETDDLVLRKNEKNFVLCLLEVARRASRFGMAAPVLIQLEQEIEEELREELDLPQEETPLPKPQRRATGFQNLDEMVQHLVSHCTCPSQFPMVKVSEGKYRVGESSTLIFVRILRNHVMVRVGGGWDTLEHYLDKHDPCRCTSIAHKQSRLAGPLRPPTPVHEIKARLTPRQDGQGGATLLLLGRTQSPLPPVTWTPSAPSRGLKPGAPPPRSASSPSPASRAGQELRPPSPSRHRERSATPPRRQPPSEGGDGSVHSASTRPGRDVTRASPSPRPRVQPSSASQPEAARPKTPLVFQKAPNQLSIHPQPALDPRLAPSWTKSQFSSKLRQSTMPSARSTEAQSRGPSLGNTQGQGGPGPVKFTVPERCRSPIKNIRLGPKQAPMTRQLAEDHRSPPEGAELIRSFSPVKQVRDEVWGEPRIRPLTPITKDQSSRGSVELTAQRKPTPDSTQAAPSSSILNRDSEQMGKLGMRSSRQDTSMVPISLLQGSRACISVTGAKTQLANPHNLQELNSKDGGKEGRELERACLFTPPPITPAQEASLYQSLEQEILTNLQLLSMDSDENSSEGDQEPGSLETPQNRQVDPSGRFSAPPAAEQSPSRRRYAAQGMSASDSSDANRGSHDAGTNEPSAVKRPVSSVDVESWVATLPRSSRDTQPQTSRAEAVSGPLRVPKPSVMSSWSSMGSSVESKEATGDLRRSQDPCREVAMGTKKPKGAVAPDAFSTTSSTGPATESPAKPRTPSFKQNRALKKPERVPSIYKLKLRPRARPRRDHRPEKKPSKIPTPLSYRRGQPGRDSLRAKMSAGRDTGTDQQGSQPSALKLCSPEGNPSSRGDMRTSQHSCRQRVKFTGRKPPVQELLGDLEQESWV